MAANAISNPTFVHVQALQSVMPTTPTDPRIITTLHLPDNLNLNRRFHVLLCYPNPRDSDSDSESGWHAAGWIKESLGLALQEHPLLAGRLRQAEFGAFEVVSNDSGVRLVEAKADISMDEFLELKDRIHKTELVFWEDISDVNPQFSPLFYVQVTNFACGGYSIGITCSLLLMDPFVATTFIKRWADTHKSTVLKSDVSKLPTFYLPSIGKPTASHILPMGPNSSRYPARSIIYKTRTKITNLDYVAKNLALTCIDKVESETGAKMAEQFALLVKGDSKAYQKVEICLRRGVLESSDNIINGLKCEKTLWDDELRLENVCFNGVGKKPICAGSSWINSVIDQGFVMITTSANETKIIVTFA